MRLLRCETQIVWLLRCLHPATVEAAATLAPLSGTFYSFVLEFSTPNSGVNLAASGEAPAGGSIERWGSSCDSPTQYAAIELPVGGWLDGYSKPHFHDDLCPIVRYRFNATFATNCCSPFLHYLLLSIASPKRMAVACSIFLDQQGHTPVRIFVQRRLSEEELTWTFRKL